MRVDSWKVTNDAVAPAGKSDECFYCNEKLGDEHKSLSSSRILSIQNLPSTN